MKPNSVERKSHEREKGRRYHLDVKAYVIWSFRQVQRFNLKKKKSTKKKKKGNVVEETTDSNVHILLFYNVIW